jgi:hypothetical protein
LQHKGDNLHARANEILAVNPLPRNAEPIREERGVDDALILDALTYAQAGSWSLFERLASRSNDDPWSLLETARLFSALGHIDLTLDPETLRPSEWSLAPPTLVVISPLAAVLAGSRSDRLIAALQAEVDKTGGTLIEEGQDAGPPIIRLDGLDADLLASIATRVSDNGLMPRLAVEESVSKEIVARLPRLSDLACALPRLPGETVASDRIQRFDFAQSKWLPSLEIHGGGAYRVGTFPRRYVVLADGAPHVADNRLVKWIGGGDLNVTMLAYDAASQKLQVRLGAQLPGLYERAAVLSSGRGPNRLKDGTVVYPAVPKELAQALHELLTT